MTTSSASGNQHLDRLIDEKSIRIVKEIHEGPRLKENSKIEDLEFRWPRVGTLSYLKPMIEENKDVVIKRLEQTDEELSLTPQANTAPVTVPGEPCETPRTGPKCKFNEFQLELFSLLRSYKDLLFTNETDETLGDIQDVYVLHVLKHLMSSRSKIISNNKRKSKGDDVAQDDPSQRDQGFTRAKVLFLLPFRYSALRVGKSIIKHLSSTHTIHHFDRFIEEFGHKEHEDGESNDSTTRPIASGRKPSDYYHTFHGNSDDSFRIGLKLTKKSIRFFSEFFDSDIIIASPLGLKTILTPGEQKASLVDDDEQIPLGGDKDFLSSVEIVVLDQAEIFLMQNWEHIIDIMQQINLMPAKPRKMEIWRVRQWYLENWSKYYRQLIMFTSISVPLVHSFFQNNSLNYEGYLTLKCRVDDPQAKRVTSKCSQHFLYYDTTSAKESSDNRFSFFIKKVLPKYTGIGNHDDNGANSQPLDHTLIMVSSYFDYVRLRNYFRREKLSFTQICEYTEANKVSKARQLFNFGARQFLIYTERCHFHNRYMIKGIRNIIFYEPPLFPQFYSEMINRLSAEFQGGKFDEASTQFTATTLFSKYDTLQMGAILGSSNAVKLIQNKKSIT